MQLNRCLEKKRVKGDQIFKASGKASSLSEHVCSNPPTRWSYVFDMFDSFDAVFNEIRQKIPDNREDIISRFNSINRTTLRAVRDYSQIFKILTKEVEGDTDVTAVNVLAVFEKLYQHIIVKPTDLGIVKRMKQTAMNYFNDNKDEVVPIDCKNWAFFNPIFKKMSNFKTADKNTVIANIKNAIEIMDEMTTAPIETVNNNVTRENANMSTDNDKSKSIFSDLEDYDQNTENNIDSEIELYLNSKPGKVTDILKYWMKNKSTYPNLWRYFMTFTAIPASSAAVERMFSLSHNIVTAKRNRLNGDVVDMLAFLNKNK